MVCMKLFTRRDLDHMKFNTTHTSPLLLSPVICFFLLLSFSTNSRAFELYFVDAHSQVDQNLESLELIIHRMDDGGVYRTILSARSGRNPEEIASFAEAYPDRIVPAVRTKSGAYNKNHPNYYRQLRKQLDSGRFKAMAEVLMYHAQKGSKAPEVIVYPDDQRVQAALNAAIENAWPFVIHIEFGSLSANKRQRFMAAMEELLQAHSAHSFALNHMGQLPAVEVRRLVNHHQNIFFLTAHTNPVIISHSKQPWVNMFRGEAISPEWKELLLQHADRFIFALDNVWETHWKEFYLDQMEYWRKAMADLPHDVAHAVAHGNAERVWGIPMPDK